MLSNNNGNIGIKILGGSLQNITHSGITRNYFISNGATFGSKVSRPQGYNYVSKAITAPLQTSGNVAGSLSLDLYIVGGLGGIGNMSSTADIETTMTLVGNVLGNIYVDSAFSLDVTATLRATGNMTVSVEVIAKPSAFDIAQEVWNAQTSGYVTTGTMGKSLNDAGAAGNPWSANLSTNNTTGTFGWLVQKLLSVSKFLALK